MHTSNQNYGENYLFSPLKDFYIYYYIIMDRMTMLENFIKESNHIEWEDNLMVNPLLLNEFLQNDLSRENIHWYHKQFARTEKRWGKRRDIQVYVWDYIPPKPSALDTLMSHYFDKVYKMDAREAHNEFEKIHPYQDFNGRIGRAIRLHKMRKNWYKNKLWFLHSYYYQTLSHI